MNWLVSTSHSCISSWDILQMNIMSLIQGPHSRSSCIALVLQALHPIFTGVLCDTCSPKAWENGKKYIFLRKEGDYSIEDLWVPQLSQGELSLVLLQSSHSLASKAAEIMWGVTLSKDKCAVISWSRSSSVAAPEALVALRTVSHKCWWEMLVNSLALFPRVFLKLLMSLSFSLLLEGALFTEKNAPGAVLWCSLCCDPTASFCPALKLCWKVLSLSLVLTNQVTNWLFLFLLMLTKTSGPTNASSGMTLHLINSEISF